MVEPMIPVLEPKAAASTPSVISRASAIRGTGRQFTHFGVMDTGTRNNGAFATSAVTNIVLAALFILISASVTKSLEEHRKMVTLTLPVEQPKPPEPAPPPPKPLPKPPVMKVEPPKIITETKLPEIPKPQVQQVVIPQTKPVIAPPPPKAIIAPAAPQPVNLGHPQAASIPNQSTNPSPVALGRPDSPIPTNPKGPAVSAVDLGQKGLPGMAASNTGSGPPASKVNLGSGQGDSQSMKGNGAQKVLGVRLGQPGGTGPPGGTGQQIAQQQTVNLGVSQTTVPKPAAVQSPVAAHPPKVLYKPEPAYTAEARAQHITGAVTVKIRVSASGGVTVLQIVSGLGHGLDESARNAVMATRFSPATDSSGHPTDWEGIVRVDFQLAGEG